MTPRKQIRKPEDIEVLTETHTGVIKWVGFLAFILWCVNLGFGLTLTNADRGPFGDMFGAVNALFTGLAFVGVIYAIFLQRSEIALAKQEIAYTKQILDEQAGQLALQNRETRNQAFESTFFHLLKLFTDLIAQIDLPASTTPKLRATKGKDCFTSFIALFRHQYRRRGKKPVDHQQVYARFYNAHKSDLGFYFRTLYKIMKFIDAADIENKKFYTNMVRAQLSDAEAAVLFHNCLSPQGVDKFKPLVEKYGFLKNVANEDIIDLSLKFEYALSAFGNAEAQAIEAEEREGKSRFHNPDK
ncbi:MAG: putative phage abortive infection protein [Cohaesibacteraceae bacterium]|nr:putative phage abortive infection protein [Cohaesibacteraceae bacterium]